MKTYTKLYKLSIVIISISTQPLTATRPTFYLGSANNTQPAVVAGRLVAPPDNAETNTKLALLWNVLTACLPCISSQHHYNPVTTRALAQGPIAALSS